MRLRIPSAAGLRVRERRRPGARLGDGVYAAFANAGVPGGGRRSYLGSRRLSNAFPLPGVRWGEPSANAFQGDRDKISEWLIGWSRPQRLTRAG
ncbi:MAG TPA: hypothetical protein VI094_18450, partial [Propionibacteriaceae bacterium]